MGGTLQIFFLILITGFLIGWLVARAFFSPVKYTARRIREILASGNTKLRVPVESRSSEEQEFLGLVNEILERNSFLAQQISAAFDNVAHDLRTPVARLRAAAEDALQRQSDVEACREALADCLEESERVLQILNTLMDVAEAETGNISLHTQEVPLFELVQEVVEMYEEVAEEREVQIRNNVKRSIMCNVDGVRLQQAIANLLDNGIKYNKKGGWVHIDCEDRGMEILISVTDSGMGIAAFELEKVWERLYRSDRSRSEKGLGLGLSFVKAIVEAHKGSVRVESCVGEGSTFYVRIPSR